MVYLDRSIVRYGELRIKMDYSKVEVNIPDKGIDLFSNLGAGGRGMELSELRKTSLIFMKI